MSRRVDLITVVVAVGAHVGLALAITGGGHGPEKPRVSTVELEFPPPEPPAAAPPSAGPPAPRTQAAPAPRPKLGMRTPHPRVPASAAPPQAAPPAAAPPAARPTPAFTVAMASTTEVSAAAVTGPAGPGGGAGLGVPGGRGAGSGAPAGDANGPVGYHPASELEVERMPEVDTDACGRTITYPAEAEQAGVEGDVRLRIALTETGRVHAVHVLSGLGHGLDRAAVEAITHRCRFSPAVSRGGKAVAFVIESYTFHFELPR